MSYIPAALVLLISASASAFATEVYKWVDENGRVHYGNSVPDAQKNKAKAVDLKGAQLTAEERAAAEARLAREKSALEQMSRKREPTQPPVASLPAQKPAVGAARKSSCEQEWTRFQQSEACFAPYRLANGGIKAEAFKVCKEVPTPNCPNPFQPSTERH